MVSFQEQTLLVLSPHPDDEILGCGGLIKRVKDHGGKVYVLFLTVGDTNDHSKNGFSSRDERIEETKKVAEFLDFDGWKIAFPGNEYHLKLDTVAQKDIVDSIENDPEISLKALHPTIIASTKNTDYNQDHRVCAQALAIATRPAPGDREVMPGIILQYDSVATCEWGSNNKISNNFYLNLSDIEFETKVKALALYASQVRSGLHQRSPEGLRTIAQFQGINAGLPMAESYFASRIIA